MGANGAGKSTLVKILTGNVRPDSGTIMVRGRERTAHSPAEARRGGMVSVYQEPSLIPDLDIRSNLRLTQTPVEPFRHWVQELGLPKSTSRRWRETCRWPRCAIIDLARALAIEPDVLMLDEMTAALPANLTERVLEVVGRQRGGDRCVIFISHRMSEIALDLRPRDRAARGRDCRRRRRHRGLRGADRPADARRDRRGAACGRHRRRRRRCDSRGRRRGLAVGARPRRRHEAAGRLVRAPYPGEVLGVVALEGQGQDELFDILSGSDARRAPARSWLTASPSPSAIPAMPSAPASCTSRRTAPRRCSCSARCARTSPCPYTRRVSRWGPINLRAERKTRRRARSRPLQIDARAGAEVRRLSGGNQQKVTIARWVAGGVQTMLCFDPTRGIDIRTKQQIYVLLRDLAEAGAAILLYTSDLNEIQLVCDRASSSSAGASWPRSTPPRQTSRRCCAPPTTCRPDAPLPEESRPRRSPPRAPRRAPRSLQRTLRDGREPDRSRGRSRPARWSAAWARSNAWALGLVAFLVVLLVFTRIIQPTYGATGIQGLAISVLPLALAAVAQAIVVISGGIDLSIGSMMALTSVVAAMLMQGQSEEFAVVVVIGVLLLGMLLGAINGAMIVLTRVAGHHRHAGDAVRLGGRRAAGARRSPGGDAADWLCQLVLGSVGNEWIPRRRSC